MLMFAVRKALLYFCFKVEANLGQPVPTGMLWSLKLVLICLIVIYSSTTVVWNHLLFKEIVSYF